MSKLVGETHGGETCGDELVLGGDELMSGLGGLAMSDCEVITDEQACGQAGWRRRRCVASRKQRARPGELGSWKQATGQASRQWRQCEADGER